MAILTPFAASPEVIASWPAPNYVDPDDRGPGLIYVCIIFNVISTILCAARVYSRVFITKALGVDDFLIVCGQVTSIVLAVLIIIGNKVFFSGRHVWDIPISTFRGHRLNVWISMWFYISTSTFVKISVLLFYRRLSVKFSKAFLIATWVGIIYNIVYMVAFFMTLLLICDPAYAYWESFDPVWASTHKFRCQTEGMSLPVSGGLSVIGDIYSTLLPFFLVYNLDLPRRQKFALYGLFALGFLSVAAGTVRTVLLYQMLHGDFDFTRILWETWIWGVIELSVAIWAASAPALKPFFKKYFVESIESIAKNKGDAVWFPSRPGSRFQAISEVSSKLHDSLVAGNIGLAVSGTKEELRQRGFLRDIGNQETKNFQMRKTDQGKLTTIQVYKVEQSQSQGLGAPRLQSHGSMGTDMSRRGKVLPMLPNTAGTETTRPHSELRHSQQTIHIALQLDPSTRPLPVRPSSEASAVMGRRKLRQQMSDPYGYGSDMNRQSFGDMHAGLSLVHDSRRMAVPVGVRSTLTRIHRKAPSEPPPAS